MAEVDKQVTIRLEAKDDLTPAFHAAARAAEDLGAKLDKAGNTRSFGDAVRGGLTRLGASMRDTSGEAGKLERSLSTAGKVADRAFRGVDRSLTPLAGRLNDAADAADKVSEKYRGMESAGRGALVAGGAMAAGLGVVVKQYADFDKAMSAVQANTGATGANLDELRQKAIELGGATQFSGKEAAQGINELAKAGVDSADILNGGLKGALSLAAAGQMDVADAAEGAASAMVQFNMKGSEVPHIADMLAAAANKAQGSVGDMTAALGQVGLVAHATGMSFDETVTALTAFASAGLIGSDAGTSLKTMLQRLSPASVEAGKAMDILGLSAYDANGNFVGLEEYAGRLKKSMAGLSPELRSATMNLIFGADAVRAANILYGEGAEGIKHWRQQLDMAQFAQKNAAALTNNLAGDWERLGGSIDTVVLQAGSGLNGFLRSVTKAATGTIDVVGKIPGPVLEGGLALGAVATAATLAGGAVMTMTPKVLAARAAFAEMSVTAGAAGVALRAVTFAGAALTLGVVVNEVEKGIGSLTTYNTKVDELASSLENLGKGQAAPEFLKMMGFSLGPIQVSMDNTTNALRRFGDQAQNALNPTVWQRVDFLKHAQDSGAFKDQVEQLDGAFARMVQSGKVDEAAASFNKVMEGAKAQGADVEKLKEQFPQYTAAVEAASKQTSNLSKEQEQALAAAAGMSVEQYRAADSAEVAAKATKSYQDAVAGLGSTLLGMRGAARDVEAAFDAADAAIQKNGTTLDISTEKGRENQAVLDGIVSASQQHASAMLKQGYSIDEVATAMDGYNARFVETAGKFGIAADDAKAMANQFGLSGDAAVQLAAQMGQIPTDITTKFGLENYEATQVRLEQLQEKMQLPPTVLQAPVMGEFVRGIAQAQAVGDQFAAQKPTMQVGQKGAEQTSDQLLAAIKKAKEADAQKPQIDVSQKGAEATQGALQKTTKDAKTTDAQKPNVSVSQTGAQAAQSQIKGTTSAAKEYDRQNPSANVSVTGTQESKSKIDGLVQKLRDFAGRTWTAITRIAQATVPNANGAIYNMNGNVFPTIRAFANGAENHVAQIAPGGAWRVWAEPETQGEAYIPLAASKRARSTAILEEVARRFGMKLVQFAEGGIHQYASGDVVVNTGNLVGGKRTVTGTSTVNVTARVTKVVVPKGVTLPFTATPGGPWDRSTRRGDLDMSNLTKRYNKYYVSLEELKDAAKDNYEAQTRLTEVQGKANASAAKSVESATKRVEAANKRLSAALAAQERLEKRKKPATAKERKAMNDRVTAARNEKARADKALKEAKAAAASGGGSSRGSTAKGSAYSKAPASVRKLIDKYAAMYGVDPNLVAAVMQQESQFNPRAKSKAGAMGLMQLMPGTARSLGVKNPYDPEQNVKGGVKLLSQLLKDFGGDIAKALAAYNAGPARARSSRALPKETQNYIRIITGDPGLGGGGSSTRKGGASVASTAVAAGTGLVSDVINEARKAVGTWYRWGGGHGNNTKAQLGKTLVDCSGLMNVALSKALHTNVNRSTRDWLRGGKYITHMSVAEALRTPGAVVVRNGHMAISLGNGRILEAPRTGKKVRERATKASEWTTGAWDTRMGTPGKGGAGGSGGGVDAKTLREAEKNAAEKQKAYDEMLKAYNTPAYVHLARATKEANVYSAGFLRNIKKIRDRGFPQVAFRLMQMGEEDGAALAASLAGAPDKVLRQQRDMFKQNEKLVKESQALEESLGKVSGPPAYMVARVESKNATGRVIQFNKDIKKIAQYDPTLAQYLASLGVADGFDLAHTIAALPAKDTKQRNAIRNDLITKPADAGADLALTTKRFDNARWTTFMDNIDKIRARGFTTLADEFLSMGVDGGFDLAARAVKQSDYELRGVRAAFVTEPQKQAMRSHTTQVKAQIGASNRFMSALETLQKNGYGDLARRYYDMGEDAAGDLAQQMASASTAEREQMRKLYAEQDKAKKRFDTLGDLLHGAGKVTELAVGVATGLEPMVRYNAPMPVDARQASPVVYKQYLGGPGIDAQRGPLVQVENMYAANPAEAGTQLETRLGDAVSVTGLDRMVMA